MSENESESRVRKTYEVPGGELTVTVIEAGSGEPRHRVRVVGAVKVRGRVYRLHTAYGPRPEPVTMVWNDRTSAWQTAESYGEGWVDDRGNEVRWRTATREHLDALTEDHALEPFVQEHPEWRRESDCLAAVAQRDAARAAVRKAEIALSERRVELDAAEARLAAF